MRTRWPTNSRRTGHKTPMKKRISSFRIVIAVFAGAIGVGTLLLLLPFATRSGQGAAFSDALFTAASATCVTGLVVQNTATYWSGFGQAVILLLIQLGGMGVITMAGAIGLVTGRRLGLAQRSSLQDALAAPAASDLMRLTGFIVKTTLALELAGAAVLAPGFCSRFGLWKGLFYGLFHAVSAFCNAGFDLLGDPAPYASFTGYAADPLVNPVLIILIVLGGLGFLTWHDIRTHGVRVRRYRMQSKVILCVTVVLILLPAAFFYFHEFAGLPTGERVWVSLFQSVTMRTAGFNTADLPAMSQPAQGLMIVLMLIGGAPGSTAGGMKVTTLAVLLASAAAVYRQRSQTACFGRRVSDGIVRTAAAVLGLYLVLFVLGGWIISLAEGLPLLTCLFESASAVGTVGVTLGITPSLGLASRLVLIVLMFCGRVGGLTLIFAVANPTGDQGRLPAEPIAVS